MQCLDMSPLIAQTPWLRVSLAHRELDVVSRIETARALCWFYSLADKGKDLWPQDKRRSNQNDFSHGCGENSLSVISGRLIALMSHLYPRGFLPSFWQCSFPPRGLSRPVFPFPSSVSFGKIRRSSFSSPHFSLSLLLTSHRWLGKTDIYPSTVLESEIMLKIESLNEVCWEIIADIVFLKMLLLRGKICKANIWHSVWLSR